ncbi:nitrate- and nitrite sensing domain-containing protein [Micromonospora sp. M12]
MGRVRERAGRRHPRGDRAGPRPELLAREDTLVSAALTAQRLGVDERRRLTALVNNQRYARTEATAGLSVNDQREHQRVATGPEFAALLALEDRLLEGTAANALTGLTIRTWRTAADAALAALQTLVASTARASVDRPRRVPPCSSRVPAPWWARPHRRPRAPAGLGGHRPTSDRRADPAGRRRSASGPGRAGDGGQHVGGCHGAGAVPAADPTQPGPTARSTQPAGRDATPGAVRRGDQRAVPPRPPHHPDPTQRGNPDRPGRRVARPPLATPGATARRRTRRGRRGSGLPPGPDRAALAVVARGSRRHRRHPPAGGADRERHRLLPADTTVRVSAEHRPQGCAVLVVDDGPGLDAPRWPRRTTCSATHRRPVPPVGTRSPSWPVVVAPRSRWAAVDAVERSRSCSFRPGW